MEDMYNYQLIVRYYTQILLSKVRFHRPIQIGSSIDGIVRRSPYLFTHVESPFSLIDPIEIVYMEET